MHAPGTDGGERDEDESQRPMMQQDFSHAEERAVNHDYAENPAPEIARQVAGLRNFGGLDGDGLPAGYVRHNFAIARDEDAVRIAGGDHSGNFAPSVNAPPIPAKHVHAAGAGADLKDSLPARPNRSELRGNVAS